MFLKLIKKISILILPILCSLPIYWLNFDSSGGDLNRIGKISVDEKYRTNIYEKMSLENLNYVEWHPGIRSGSFDIVTIGDSFSQQGQQGYQNYIGNLDENLKVLNIPNKYFMYNRNPFQNLIALLNGDFFKHIQADYIVLESVERGINILTEDLSFDHSMNLEEIEAVNSPIISSSLDILIGEIYDANYFLVSTVLYNLDDNAFFSHVYRFDTNKTLFSGYDDILIYQDDIRNIDIKNDFIKTTNTNDFLNDIARLSEKRDLKLIFLPAPDKYTIYQDYFVNNHYDDSVFFTDLNKLEKEYFFIDSYSALFNQTQNNILDIYYYDDSHWSPIGSEIIAQEIISIISEEN